MPAYLVIGVLALLSLSLSACNTVDGIGKDIEDGGEAIQESAQ